MVGVYKNPEHMVSKLEQPSILLVENMGVDGDVHMGSTVRHPSRLLCDKVLPNLRQVHLISSELYEELQKKGFVVWPGVMGENITTRGIDLLHLPTDTLLYIGRKAVVRVTGLRNPCKQLDGVQEGLMAAVLDRDREGNLIRKAGVMGVVLEGGEVHPGDRVTAVPPPEPHRPLVPV